MRSTCDAASRLPRGEGTIQAARITVEGIVQGVGFRPFVFRLAYEHGLVGTVSNSTSGVFIEIEGDADDIAAFYEDISAKRPPQAHVLTKDIRYIEPKGFKTFEIRSSLANRNRIVPISPDLGICDDCLRELCDPTDRRYRYPFINCTNCGPRFTIIQDIPYDRDKTTMVSFRMCEACRAEYKDPRDRRFHAQPNACPVCGPQVRLVQSSGESIATEDPFQTVQYLLQDGQVIAVKGIGGYHLACHARNAEAVSRLRQRKYREDKPFAVMIRDTETARALCTFDEAELSLLTSVQRPIVLVRKGKGEIAPDVAPGQKYLGIMLPYTPLHHLLFSDKLDVLVMTSGNISDEPIAYEDEEAMTRLAHIADAFLVHNRPIFMRTDDTVSRIVEGREQLVRRSRGYAPTPLHLSKPFVHRILACGAELKNTFCLTRGQDVFLSHHIGDLENIETLTSFEKGIEHFKKLFYIEPDLVAYDLHPQYLSTQYALALPELPKVGVQHHHAHIASCLADNDVDTRAIGVAFDGTGYGTDGTIWGGEFLIADPRHFERVAHLEYVSMPGGDQAIREPWRMAASYLYKVHGSDLLALDIDFVNTLDRRQWNVLAKAIDAQINSPSTSSLGRLFDAVSVLLGICTKANYEGQAAIALEMAADENMTEAYPFEIDLDAAPMLVRVDGMIRAIVDDIQHKVSAADIAGKFHQTWAQIIASACASIRERTGLNEVALSGGVFQNTLLVRRTKPLLLGAGFRVLTHHRVPPNDGGIALGQAVVAEAQAAPEA